MFRRKGEGSSQNSEPNPEELDLGPLTEQKSPVVEPDTSFEPVERAVEPGTAAVESAAGSVIGTIDRAINEAKPVEVPVPRKKRYYSPSEVRRKKGCIGCGGMVLVIPLLLSVAGIVVALF